VRRQRHRAVVILYEKIRIYCRPGESLRKTLDRPPAEAWVVISRS
jgi:hypothetical protein